METENELNAAQTIVIEQKYNRFVEKYEALC